MATAGFTLESVSAIQPGTVRVRFTEPPLQAGSSGAHDALNPVNYLLVGPGMSAVVEVAPVSSDPFAIELHLSRELPPGVWNLAVANVRTVAGEAVSAPQTLSFTVRAAGQEGVSGGARNDDPEETIQKHFNPGLKGRANRGWRSLIGALATGDLKNLDNAQSAFDQLSITSASSSYLDRRASDYGIQRPTDIGMSDSQFRQLALIVKNRQLTQEAMLEVLEVFYGGEAVRAYVETAGGQPFALVDGADLQLLFDGRVTRTIAFRSANFSSIGAATALEVAVAITTALRAQGDKGYAAAVFVPSTQETRVRIYSASRGLSSSVQITGGRAQNALSLPTKLDAYGPAGSLPTWTIVFSATDNTVSFTVTGTTNLDLSGVYAGDYVNIYGTEFNAGNRGSFPITAVSVSYPSGTLTQSFSIVNTGGVSQAGIVQSLAADLQFFRPSRATTQLNPSRAVIVAQAPGIAEILMPATTQIIVRTALTGAHLKAPTALPTPSSIVRSAGVVTVTLAGHGLGSAGDTRQLFIDGLRPSSSAPPVYSGSFSAGPPATGTTDGSVLSIMTQLGARPTPGAIGNTATLLGDGRVLIAGGTDLMNALDDAALVTITGTVTTHGVPQYTYKLEADGTMPQGIYYGAATLMGQTTFSGDVLYTGGITAGGFVADSARYTPAAGATGAWVAGPNMNAARVGHSATGLPDGTILIAGGAINSTTSTATCELFDEITDFTLTGSLNDSRCDHLAFLLADGTVMAVGGRTITAGNGGQMPYGFDPHIGLILNTCEIFSAGTWTRTGSMAFARVFYSACVLPDGRIFVAGGMGNDPATGGQYGVCPECEIYDPRTGAWQPAGRLSSARINAACFYTNGRVYVVGGVTASLTSVYTIEVFDPATFKWSISRARLAAGYFSTRPVVLASGGVYLAGGLNFDNFTGHDDDLFFTPGKETFATGALGGPVTATVVDGGSFTYRTRGDYSVGTGGTFTPMAAPAATAGAPGPFAYDTSRGIAITGIASTTTQAIARGHQYASLSVADATAFPDEPGYLCLSFGFAEMTQPVPYFGRLSATALLVDFTFRFPFDLPSGASVTYLKQRGPWVPEHPEQVGSFYLTHSSAGRVSASSFIDRISAAGISIVKTVEYPSDRGLGKAGSPDHGAQILSDRVAVWGGNDLDSELAKARVS